MREIDQAYFDTYNGEENYMADPTARFCDLNEVVTFYSQHQFVKEKPEFVIDIGAATGAVLAECQRLWDLPDTSVSGVEKFGSIINHPRVLEGDASEYLTRLPNNCVDVALVNMLMYLPSEEILPLLQQLCKKMRMDSDLAVVTVRTDHIPVTYTQTEELDYKFCAHYRNGVLVEKDEAYVKTVRCKGWWLEQFSMAGFQVVGHPEPEVFYLSRNQAMFNPKRLPDCIHLQIEFPKTPFDERLKSIRKKLANPILISYTHVAPDHKQTKKSAIAYVDDSQWWCDKPLHFGAAQELIRLIETGALGPVRNFEIEVADLINPHMFIKGAYRWTNTKENRHFYLKDREI